MSWSVMGKVESSVVGKFVSADEGVSTTNVKMKMICTSTARVVSINCMKALVFILLTGSFKREMRSEGFSVFHQTNQ